VLRVITWPARIHAARMHFADGILVLELHEIIVYQIFSRRLVFTM
jgi:hypothetical protein